MNMATGGTNLSKEFFELLKAIGESKSKQEEDRIILKEVQTLKKKLESPSGPSTPGQPAPANTLLSSKKRAKEFMVRLLYVEMLGHDASFGYIKALEMTASASLYHKRTGYLVCSACLSPQHEFRFMLVNQMQRDLQSSHVLEICGGLLATSSLITPDMVPAVSGEVSKLLGHASETVRKKAIMAMHRFHQLAPETVPVEDMVEKLRKVLCDRDPAVMGASLNVIEAMAQIQAHTFKDLIPSLVSILKQIEEHRLPTDYDYHRVPAPWMQIKLVRLLGVLGRNDAAASSGMYEILNETMKKADIGINAGYAIVYECIRTIVQIYPNATLLDAAGEAISRFIQSRSHNLKYLGVTGLALIVETHPQYAAAHQIAVMDCLEDTDETLQRKTLDLLYRMTNPVNVEFITEKMLEFLRGTTDVFLKNVLTTRICSVSERYAPNNAWYIRTITDLFEISGDMVSPQVAQNLMSLIAEGTGENEETDMLLRQTAIEIYVTLLKEKPAGKLPKILLETMAWCLGEYGYLSSLSSIEDVLESLCAIVRIHKAKLAPTTLKLILSAVMKLIAQAGTCPPHAASLIDDFTHSQDVDLQQRCLEFQNLLTSAPQLLGQVLPVDASAEDIDVDVDLTFMNGYVNEALNNGAKAYDKPEDDDDDDDMPSAAAPTSAFNLTPYEKPTTPSYGASNVMRGIGSDGGISGPPGVALPPGSGYGSSMQVPNVGAIGTQMNELQLNTSRVANVWGKSGLSQPPPAPAPSNPYGVATPSNPYSSPAQSNPYGTQAPNNYGGFGGRSDPYGSAPAPAPVEVPKSKEQLEKERMAAAFFGGVIPGQPPPPPRQMPSLVTAPPSVSRTTFSAPAPAPEAFDLLDFGAPVAVAATPSMTPALDIFAPQPFVVVAPAAPIVETVTDDVLDYSAHTPVIDPFAASGLLGGVADAPMTSFESSSKFEYNGIQLAPLAISTAQFGQQWGMCPATCPISVVSNKITSLDNFMSVCAEIGSHKVEAIAATSEGICAGNLGGSIVVLIHAKVTALGGSSKIDLTVKSTDVGVSNQLAMFVKGRLR